MERSMIIIAWVIGIIMVPFLVLGIAQAFMSLVEWVVVFFGDFIDWVVGGR